MTAGPAASRRVLARTPVAPLPASSPTRPVGINGRTSAPPDSSLPDVCSCRLPLTIGPGLQQRIHHPSAGVVGSKHEWGHAKLVGDVDVGAGPNQYPHRVQIVPVNGPGDGGRPIGLWRVHIDLRISSREQGAHSRPVLPLDRICERRPVLGGGSHTSSRLLKNTRIGLFSWPSCVSRPPRQRCARGHAVPTRGPATPAAGDQGHLASRFRNRTT